MRVLLSDVAERITGNVDRHNCDYVYYVGGEHYDSGEIAIYKRGLLDSEKGLKLGFKFHFPFRAGDTLFMARNPHLRKAGMVTYDGICSDASYIIRPLDNDTLDKRFIPLLFQSNAFWQFFEENKSGSVNYLMNWKELQKFEFELPSIERQREIAELAWAVEGCRVKYKKLLTVCDDIVKSRFVEMFGDTEENPREYPIKQLGELLLVERGGSPRPISQYITDDEDGVNWIKIGDASENSIFITQTKERIKKSGINKSRHVQPGDFLLSNSMSFGRPYILKVDGYIHDGWLVLRDNNGVFDSMYLYALLSSDSAKRYYLKKAAGSTVKNLNKEIVGSMPVLVPPINEQKEYAAFLSQVDKAKIALQQSLDELNATMTAILNEELGTRDV